MPAIVKKLTIATAPGNVFNALTRQDQLALWWTNDLSVKPEVGSLAEFRFLQGAYALQFEVAELDTNQKVSWITRQGPGFEGTTITWQLTPAQNGTQVLFTQDGFGQIDETYERIHAIWEYFLSSLKSYLETGKGTPGFPASFS
jgi:uncharacterized protein YndB with AHSA1/START domain